ncbi:hypothetical protein K1719_027085 [Acacia pycnantha]|nr:hypothetical protein K1719_027085 [Acacia pycnantha]
MAYATVKCCYIVKLVTWIALESQKCRAMSRTTTSFADFMPRNHITLCFPYLSGKSISSILPDVKTYIVSSLARILVHLYATRVDLEVGANQKSSYNLPLFSTVLLEFCAKPKSLSCCCIRLFSIGLLA